MKFVWSVDATPAPLPSVNAWEKPISVTLLTQNALSTTNLTANGEGIPNASSKSSSFDRDNHDSGVEVSDQPASGASSQRSSPSNDCRMFSKTVGVVTTDVLQVTEESED